MNKLELVNKTMDDLRKVYPEGLYEFLFKFKNQTYKRLLCLEKNIEDYLLSSEMSANDLKSVLREYWDLHQGAIQEYRNFNGKRRALEQAREERYESRACA